MENLTELYGLKVEYKLSNKNGYEYRNFYVPCVIKNKQRDAELVPAQNNRTNFNRFEAVDMVVDGAKEIFLLRDTTRDQNGRDAYVYYISSVDEDGVEYRATVQPRKTGDRDVLEQAIRIGIARRRKEKEAEETAEIAENSEAGGEKKVAKKA